MPNKLLFNLPVSTNSLSAANTIWADSFFTRLHNFSGNVSPTNENIIIETNETPPPDGMLYYSNITGALYTVDSTRQKGNPILGGEYTKVGMGIRYEPSLLTLNIGTYEVGELFYTNPAINARIYIKSSNTGTYKDIGIPESNTVTPTMLATQAVDNTKLGIGSITTNKFANLTINTVHLDANAISIDKLANSTPNTFLGWSTDGLANNLPGLTSIFSKSFISANIALSQAFEVTISHGMNTVPKIIQLYLVCQSADRGYVQGDYLAYSEFGDVDGFGGIIVRSTSQFITIKQHTYASIGIIFNKNANTYGQGTQASWNLQIKAFA